MANKKPNVNLEESFKKIFIDTATEVNNQYGHDAGRLLSKYKDASVMTIYRTTKQAIERMKNK